jgi:hypothetical protein
MDVNYESLASYLGVHRPYAALSSAQEQFPKIDQLRRIEVVAKD